MAQVIPKLNLNKTPALVEDNSLVFSKNIRLDVDGTIHRDYGVFPMSIHKGNNTPNLVNYKNILNRIISDIKYEIDNNTSVRSYYTTFKERLESISNDNYVVKNEDGTDKERYEFSHRIVGIIPSSNEFYVFINGTKNHITITTITNEAGETEITEVSNLTTVNAIICYDEKEDKFYPCNCNWNWSGGTINGCVINNLVGEKILNIAESGTVNLVPLKSINLASSSINDNESIYTQIPNVPLTNLSYADSFSYVIPNGVYQFFVRYRIRKDFYTDWFPASKEIFVGNKNSVVTSFGTLKYTNIHRDSDNSFILSVEHLIDKNKANYNGYQIGFVLTHDDATYARAWKHFNFNVTSISFDYKAEDAEELEVTDFIKPTFGLYNVSNITTFKNRLYISNYTETEFNDRTLQDYADKIKIDISKQAGGNSYAGYEPVTATIGNKSVIAGLHIDSTNPNGTTFIGETGIINKIISNASSVLNKPSISAAITNALNGENDSLKTDGYSPDNYGIRITLHIDALSSAKNKVRDTYKNKETPSVRQIYTFDFNDDSIKFVSINDKQVDKSEVLPYIYNTPRYIDYNFKWVNVAATVDDSISIKIARHAKVTSTTTYYGNSGGSGLNEPIISGDPEIPDGDITTPSDDIGHFGSSTTTRTFSVTYYQTIELQFLAFASQYSGNDVNVLTNYTTLVPYQKYKFYIHFVKNTGEITNGYYCSKAGEIEAPYMEACSSIIYPIFKGIEIPVGYVSCFFSISHTQINSATIFEIKENGLYKEGTCIDVNMMLLPANRNIHIQQGYLSIEQQVNSFEPTAIGGGVIGGNKVPIETYSGQYYYSSDASLPRYFGANGVITFDKTGFSNEKLAYIVNEYTIPETENIELVKCTPYLNSKNIHLYEDENDSSKNYYYFDDYTTMNLLGYFCHITSLNRQQCIDYYSDGSSVYYKSPSDDNQTLNLTELSKYDDADVEAKKKLANFILMNTNDQYIYSNYNLNYVALTEEPKLAVKTYYTRSANAEAAATEKEESQTASVILRLIPSQLMSDVYTLPSMYKKFIRKIYSTYIENETVRFDNTVRSSILYGDENKVNVLTFDANDYYNIPTNRGIIINMISVGDAILVHTQDSMFKFSGSNTIQSADGEILMQESKPFDTGVSEVFGSDFGFAGLQNKSDHIVTENGYIFFDRDSRIVYLYSGQGQITKVSESIEKLFRHKNIKNINFANDYYNNRFFMSIVFYETYDTTENGKPVTKEKYYPVTLSFNVSEQIKSFVSLHDFYYHYAFNTKTKCYFLTNDNKDICTVNKDYKGYYSKVELSSDKTYPQQKQINKLSALQEDNANATLQEYNINNYNSIIDIIVNENFETVKTLNAVNWCGTKIISEFKDIDETDVTTLRVAEDINYDIPCRYIRIYTDSCMSPLNDCTIKSNDKSISDVNNYKYPRYNQGFWTFNYFRNILNTKLIPNKRPYISDDNSLIEGKYFVIRFIFDNDFKFEALSLNYNNKL